MDAEQLAKFKLLLKEYLEASVPAGTRKLSLETSIDMAEHDSRLEGLDYLRGFEVELRKYDLAQIGFIILSTIGELNHGSWDGYNREELKQYNWVFGEFLQTFLHWEPYGGSYRDSPWGFGGDEHWDRRGVRHTKES